MPALVSILGENFEKEVIGAQVLTVVDFGAEWCEPCKKLHPILEEIADDFNGRVKIGYLDVGTAPQIAQQYAVMSVPRLIFFKDGKPIHTIVGFASKPKIAEAINYHL
jgi:thioredoxin 1